jgi:hypothetical protein
MQNALVFLASGGFDHEIVAVLATIVQRFIASQAAAPLPLYLNS